MDINEWVAARIEANSRRQVMLTLFSQTDVMLWGIDSNYRMYICEGGLDWDPSLVEKILECGTQNCSAHSIGVEDNTSREELVNTIREALSGKAVNPIVEHWEGARFLRTRCVAEPTAEGDGVRAVLALTFDITDERSRTTLQDENQRLINNEKIAMESNNLKSSFLANVRRLTLSQTVEAKCYRCLMRSALPFQVSSA